MDTSTSGRLSIGWSAEGDSVGVGGDTEGEGSLEIFGVRLDDMA
jgi:hypothetical protein